MATLKRDIWRYWLVGAGLILVPIGLGARIWLLTQQPDLLSRAQTQQTQVKPVFVPRLTIVDRNQNVLATDQEIYTLYFHPKVFYAETLKQLGSQGQTPSPELVQQVLTQKAKITSALLAPIVERSPEEITQLITKSPRSTELLARQVHRADFEHIQTLLIPRNQISPDLEAQFLDQTLDRKARRTLGTPIPGIEAQIRRQRTYPLGPQLAPLLGFIDYNGQGQAGLEQKHNQLLKNPADLTVLSTMMRRPDKTLPAPVPTEAFQINGFGQLVAADAPAKLVNDQLHQRLQLTLDAKLQDSASRALAKGMALYKPQRGAAIVMDPQNGAILALAVSPTYDNNQFGDYAKDPKKYFQVWPVTEIYEPGSTFKPINIAIGLDSGKVHPDDVIYDPGSLTLSKYTIRNFDGKARGALSVTEVLMYSNNIGMVKLMSKVGAGEYYDRLRAIGIGKQSGVDLPNEAAGVFKTREQFIRYPIEAATPAYGQGITMTPLQLLRFHCALANGGWLVTPHLAQAIVDEEWNVVKALTYPAPRRIFSAESTAIVEKMLIQVVEAGSGQKAKIPGYWIAGKTGTAQKVKDGGRGYVPGQRVTSFVGHFPGDHPRYVILVVFDQPQGKVFGGGTAAPVVHDILQELIGYEGILPTRKIDQTAQVGNATN